jgi:hypothetical protein
MRAFLHWKISVGTILLILIHVLILSTGIVLNTVHLNGAIFDFPD